MMKVNVSRSDTDVSDKKPIAKVRYWDGKLANNEPLMWPSPSF